MRPPREGNRSGSDNDVDNVDTMGEAMTNETPMKQCVCVCVYSVYIYVLIYVCQEEVCSIISPLEQFKKKKSVVVFVFSCPT